MLYELLDDPGPGWPRSFGRAHDVGAARAPDPWRSRGARSIPVRAAAVEPAPANVESESVEPLAPRTGELASAISEPEPVVAPPQLHDEQAQPQPEATDEVGAAEASQIDAARADEKTTTERLRRAVRELEAAKGRVERDAERMAQQTRSELIAKLLPVLGNLDRSIAAAGGDTDRALLEGLKLVRAQFEEVLLGYGLERVASVGRRFDPAVHEAVAVKDVTDPAKDRVVIEEWEPGYRLEGQLLRAAKVRVGRLA